MLNNFYLLTGLKFIVCLIMAIMEIFQIINVKNHYLIKSCLVISLVTVTTWITKVLRKNNKIRQNDNAQQFISDKITSIPLIIITGCDTGLGY